MDDLTLRVSGQNITGWESIRVTRSLERFPSDFAISLSERYSGEFNMVTAKPGDACSVMLGDDVVVTGYIDSLQMSISNRAHILSVAGRGKCCDLVDCSAEWPGGQISCATVLALAQKLALPYSQQNGGIQVTCEGDEIGLPIPVQVLNFGETPYDMIERACRYRALLCYELPNGNLHLSRAGLNTAASGFTQGVNIQAASIDIRADQRFSEITAQAQSLDVLGDMGNAGYLKSTVVDAGVNRHRLKYVISEQGYSGKDVLEARALWECNRRIGRSQVLNLTTDSWRDSSGALYSPNTLVSISLPALKLTNVTWLISEVCFRLDAERGTTCDLVIMPQEAFLVDLPALGKFGDVLQRIQDSGWAIQ